MDVRHKPFTFATVPSLAAPLHRIDREAAGSLGTPTAVTDSGTKDRYLVSSWFEEAISSSQLEGASTTRETAKKMLREGRPPANHGERMIVNNFRAVEWLRERRDDELTPAMVFEPHRLLSEGPLENPADAGRFRLDSDDLHMFLNRKAEEGRHARTRSPSRATACSRNTSEDTSSSLYHRTSSGNGSRRDDGEPPPRNLGATARGSRRASSSAAPPPARLSCRP